MRQLVFIVLLLVASALAIGQQPASKRQIVITIGEPVIVFVSGLETIFPALIIDTAKVRSPIISGKQHVSSKDNATIVNLELKHPRPQLVRLNEILKHFSIPENKRSLRVCIDKVLIKDTSKILADLSYIQRVEITKDKYPTSGGEENAEEEVINIVTPRTFRPGL